MCGEHHRLLIVSPGSSGSSPHVRGTRPYQRTARFVMRFIPACAGNTRIDYDGQHNQPVHPRMCGEHTKSATIKVSLVGSSPHVRGTRSKLKKKGPVRRFIPACAGNTEYTMYSVDAVAVHPRMCGEHGNLSCTFYPSNGSSPHVRGTLRVLRLVCSNRRFIPACAGNTGDGETDVIDTPVHPRMCGEHTTIYMPLFLPSGSSPHVRGTRWSRWSCWH